MDIDLSQLNNHSESETLELKESFDKQALETIGAFANSAGGTILIGVRDDGHVTGITIGNTTLEEWAQKMQAKIQPRFLPSITRHQHNGRTVVAISVERSNSLICVEGRYIKRVGRTNQIMSPDETKQRLLASGSETWDNRIEEKATLADLDGRAIDQFIAKVNKVGRRPVPEDEEQRSILAKLGLMVNAKPTRAAILLFGNAPKQFYSSAFVKAGRFKSATTIVDDKEFSGTLFEQIEDAMSWFKSRLETRLIIGGPGSLVEREEVWQYPLPALKEAIANAVCHRNYQSLVATTIRLYDDHLEIWNPGTLPSDLQPEDLLRHHISHAPNRLIAEAFYNTGIIERWGTGTVRMAELLDEQGLPAPQFDVSTKNVFKVMMLATGQSDRRLHDMGLNDRQIKAIRYLQANNILTATQYQDLWKTSKATATRDLGELAAKGLIAREGKGASTTYRLAVSI